MESTKTYDMEDDEGNIEYKLKLSDSDPNRIGKLVSQMKYRVDEGGGEAIYVIGVTNSGDTPGLTANEYNETYSILETIVRKNNYSMLPLTRKLQDNDKYVYEFLIRENNEEKYIDIQIAIAGNADSGKCVHPQTRIVMSDFSTKSAVTIKIGDVLLGLDGKGRTVLNTEVGKAEMYHIIQASGYNKKVTGNHMLTLKFRGPFVMSDSTYYHPGDGYVALRKGTSLLNLKNVELLDITVNEYLTKSNEWKKLFVFYQARIELPESDIRIDPYSIGSWIAHTKTEDHKSDYEYIPRVCIFNSIRIRSEVLAGIIDNIGIIRSAGVYIQYPESGFIRDITFLSNSLGYTTVRDMYATDDNFYYTIYIYGNLSILPCKVLDLKDDRRSMNKAFLLQTKNTIVSIGIQEYVGFQITDDNRFLFEDFFVTHNSSFVGVLTTGTLDNGRGSSRLSVFNYKHEVDSGRTSSIGRQILGFDEKSEIVNYLSLRKQSWKDIVKSSKKIISFSDLCGHEKYLKTTISNLCSSTPDMCMIIVGANMGITRITREHIFLCMIMKIPFSIVITKVDICKTRENVLAETEGKIRQLLNFPSIRRIPYSVKTTDNVVVVTKNIYSESVVPIFYVSNVTGEGLDIMKLFLNLLPKRKQYDKSGPIEYIIDCVFKVPGAGTIIGGILKSGTLTIPTQLLLGPMYDGSFDSVQVKSIHCKKIPVRKVDFECYVCVGLKRTTEKKIERGQVLVSPSIKPSAIYEFEADIIILKGHSTTIRIGYEPILQVGMVRQTARIVDIILKNGKEISNPCMLRSGDRAYVRFRYKYKPEYIKKDDCILLCEGKIKANGLVKRLLI